MSYSENDSHERRKSVEKLYISHSHVLLSKWELYPICFMGKKGLLSTFFRHKHVVGSAGFAIFLRRWYLSLNHSVVSTLVWAVAQRILPERTWAHTSKTLREWPNCYCKGNLEGMLLILPQWTSSIFLKRWPIDWVTSQRDFNPGLVHVFIFWQCVHM